MPSRWEIALAGPVAGKIPLGAPHAVVSGWLDDRDAGSPRSGHADKVKRWALGPLRTGGRGITLEVRLLDDALADRLVTATGTEPSVRLGSSRYRVCEPPRLTEHASWQELAAWPGARAWQVRFVTPACARRRNRATPLLHPDTLATGLTERWRLLDPATAPAPPWLPGPGPVWISDLDGRTQVQILSRTARPDSGPARREEVISGFTGRVRYVCDHGTDAEAAAFGALLAFAGYGGAGSHTAYGFGVMEPEPTWQPPTARADNP